MLSPNEAAAVAQGQDFKRYIRAAAAMQGIYEDVELGRAVGVHRRTVAGWWLGAKPSPDTLRAIASTTGLAVDELLAFTYYDGPPPHLPDPVEDEAQGRAEAAERSRHAPPGDAESAAPPAPHETTGSGR